MSVKKQTIEPQGKIKKNPAPNPELRFSFKFFDVNDKKLCPDTFSEGYTQTLMQRLRDLSGWTIKEFTNCRDSSVRIHPVDWPETTRPNGFSNLNEHYRDTPAWQFGLTANKHGRVHGILIDDTFHVIWLDKDHNLYA